MRKTTVLVTVLIILALLLILIPANASASEGDAATLDDRITVQAFPAQQAIGGEVEIRVNFNIFGGCCYHLYTYDVVPVIDFPEEIVVLDGPTPERIDEIDGLPGGEPVPNKFSWTVVGTTEGDYVLKVRVETGNSGSVEGEGFLKITAGAVITTPVVFPTKPETDRDTTVSFDVYSSTQGIDVEEVSFFYMIFDEADMNLTPEGPKVTVNDDGLIKMTNGNKLQLTTSASDPTEYRVTLPSQDSETYIYFWVYARDSTGYEVTTPVNEVKITDFDKANTVVRSVFASLVILSIIGIFLIVLVYTLAEKRKVRDKTKLYRLGSSGNTEFMDEEDLPKETRPVILYIVIILAIAIAVALIVMSFYTGSFDEIITHLREGK
jgi:hypothetical protein